MFSFYPKAYLDVCTLATGTDAGLDAGLDDGLNDGLDACLEAVDGRSKHVRFAADGIDPQSCELSYLDTAGRRRVGE